MHVLLQVSFAGLGIALRHPAKVFHSASCRTCHAAQLPACAAGQKHY
jgi:hypothetical protein